MNKRELKKWRMAVWWMACTHYTFKLGGKVFFETWYGALIDEGK